MAKLIGLILTATLLFGVCKASFNEEFCPEGSQLYLVDPNQDGTCPDVLPTVNTENEENKNKCEEVNFNHQTLSYIGLYVPLKKLEYFAFGKKLFLLQFMKFCNFLKSKAKL